MKKECTTGFSREKRKARGHLLGKMSIESDPFY